VAKRFSVQGRGLGDIRATGYYWILAPKPEKKLSLLGGLGLKSHDLSPNHKNSNEKIYFGHLPFFCSFVCVRGGTSS